VKLVTADQMRRLEASAEHAGVSTAELMENAGLAAAQEGWMLLGTLEGRIIAVLVGPGNNGGDGLVAARHLHDWGADTRVYLSRERDEEPNLTQLRDRGLQITSAGQDPERRQLQELLAQAHLIVDALLGTGRSRPIEGTMAGILGDVAGARSRAVPPKLLALDLPSGLDADNGAVDALTPIADETVTFGLAKVGLYSSPGSAIAGRIQVVDIGIPAGAQDGLPLSLLTRAWAREHLPHRAENANKGTFGKVMVVAGSVNYVGAAFLAAASAYRAGAGLVTLAVPRSLQPALVPMVPEATFLPLPEREGALAPESLAELRQGWDGYDVLLVGCGIGHRAQTQAFVHALLDEREPGEQPAIVVDADGLNALAADETWWTRFNQLAILTPHPGEFARLASMSVADVQADRVETALDHAQLWHKIVVLKGANTVIALPDGRAMLSPFANPALATAGTGDVLAGTIAGLLAQGLEPATAAATGVYLHGTAGELMSQSFGEAGGLAGDLLRLLPAARSEIVHPH
jgi:ADP-dependent NAD(P)H-hydrate dehydratase / NAD(P)H-hydrate epimerase